MKHIIKVNNIQDAKDSDIRPIVAMDANRHLFFEGKAAGPQIEFVDLGLSVKWGNANLGATNGDTAESWYGNYYAWGEIKTKEYYEWSNYKFGASQPFSKYDSDGKTVLESVDDAAYKTNSAWRMPTKAELDELIALPNIWVANYDPNKTEHTTDDGGIQGLNGRVFTGINGNTMFIPAAGDRNGSDFISVGSGCDLWSSSLNLANHSGAYHLYFNSNYVRMDYHSRFLGFRVRPIC